MLYGISIILVSITAIPSLLLSRQPNAVELLRKVRLLQGRMGVAAGVLGICQMINCYSDPGLQVQGLHIWPVTVILCCLAHVVLGFLLGFPAILEKTGVMSLRKPGFAPVRWAHKQGIAGIAALILGTWTIIASFIYEMD